MQKSGALITELSASQTMFHAVPEQSWKNVKWGKKMQLHLHWNIRSAHDAVEYYCKLEQEERIP